MVQSYISRKRGIVSSRCKTNYFIELKTFKSLGNQRDSCFRSRQSQGTGLTLLPEINKNHARGMKHWPPKPCMPLADGNKPVRPSFWLPEFPAAEHKVHIREAKARTEDTARGTWRRARGTMGAERSAELGCTQVWGDHQGQQRSCPLRERQQWLPLTHHLPRTSLENPKREGIVLRKALLQ